MRAWGNFAQYVLCEKNGEEIRKRRARDSREEKMAAWLLVRRVIFQ